MLLLGLSLVLAAGCCKKPNDSKTKSKWVILNEGREINARNLFFADSLNGWAINDGGGWTNAYYRTRDGGRTWEFAAVPPPPNYAWVFFDLAFTDTLNGWMVGDHGLIYHTRDGGHSWNVDNRLNDPGHVQPYPYIKTVFFLDSLHGWIGMDAWEETDIARTTDGGLTWQVIPVELWLLQALDGNVAFAGDYYSTKIYRTQDGGTSWQEIYPAMPLSRGGGALVSFISEMEGWAVIGWQSEYAGGGWLMHTRDGGATWDTLLSSNNGSFGELHMLPSREGWMMAPAAGPYPGQGSIILHTVDGKTWAQDPLPDVGDRALGNLFVLPGPQAWVMAGGLVLKRE